VERRLLTFFIASTAFLLLYISLQKIVGPKPAAAPVAAENADAADLLADAEAADLADTADRSSPLGDVDESAVKRPESGKWFTLGSMDPKSNYLMLMTLNSAGGGVERIELTERDKKNRLKYHRVDVRSGYLGYLAASPASEVDGVTVNVVGPGTPADVAGLKVGDVIVSVGEKTVLSRKEIDDALLDTKPGDQVKLNVIRKGSSTAKSVTVTLSEHPLDLVRLASDAGIDQIEGNLSRQSCLMTLSQINRKSIPTSKLSIPKMVDPTELVWTAKVGNTGDDGKQSVEFALELSQSETEVVGGSPLRLKRSFAVMPGSYAVDMDMQVDNLGDEAQDLAIRIEGANGITLEGWWYSNKISPNWSGAAARDIIYRTAADGHQLISGFNLLKRARKEVDEPFQTIFAPDGDTDSRNLKYIGVDAQYFTVSYIPPTDQQSLTTFKRAAVGLIADVDEIPRHKERAVNTTFFLDTATASVPAGGSMRQQLKMFAGPKDPEILANYGLGDAVYYGWFARFASLLAGLLHTLAGFFGNYAVAIIVLTVIVRGAMFPLSRKAAVNAQKMQELAPELKKIADQHKEDIQARMAAQRELQKRVGFNPMAGCLPMFLQLPIFIGLYRALSVDIELRQQPLFPGLDWASNLAGPDMFRYWGDWMFDYFAGRGTGWLGPYFNILPVIVVGLFLLQQKLFMPPATDEQTAMTQKMMSIMTLMMGLFFFRVPAGLCLYFITSSLWGICERVLVKKTIPQKSHFDLATPDGVVEGSAKPTEKPKVSLAQRIKDQVNGPEPTFDRPNKRKKPKKK
jgi:YidC/Oxa1 family membrane protein insertase